MNIFGKKISNGFFGGFSSFTHTILFTLIILICVSLTKEKHTGY